MLTAPDTVKVNLEDLFKYNFILTDIFRSRTQPLLRSEPRDKMMTHLSMMLSILQQYSILNLLYLFRHPYFYYAVIFTGANMLNTSLLSCNLAHGK